MIRITLKLSESLLSIYKSANQILHETIIVEAEQSMTIKEILGKAGISPMLTPLIIVNDKSCSSLNAVIVEDSTVTLIGPLAGG